MLFVPGSDAESSPMEQSYEGNPIVIINLTYEAGIGGGSDIEGEIVIELFLNWAPITVTNFVDLVNQSFYDGGRFLGVTREDTSKQISLSYPVYKRFAVSIGYEINDSTVNSFSHTGPLVSFSLPTFNF